MKTQISVFPWAKIGQNDHSNPYIESTTVLSDKFGSTVMPALMIPYDTIHICMHRGSCGPQA